MTSRDLSASIVSILAEPAGFGSFSESHVDGNEQVTHHFTFAAGWGWSVDRREYEARFGVIPGWVLAEHPSHRRCLCQLALRSDISLPKHRPT